jgi:hypothetical protein
MMAAGAAFADSAKGRVITLRTLEIIGRVQKPMAAVEVSRVQPTPTLTELKQPFADRIEQVVARDPY